MDELDLARLTPEATPAALAQWQRAHAVGDEWRVHGRWLGPVPFAATPMPMVKMPIRAMARPRDHEERRPGVRADWVGRALCFIPP